MIAPPGRERARAARKDGGKGSGLSTKGFPVGAAGVACVLQKQPRERRVASQQSYVDYYRKRAEQELRRSDESDDPILAAAHYQLAEIFLERLSRLRGTKHPDCGMAD